MAETHHADAPPLRRRDPDLAPDLRLLLGDEVQEIAMQGEHRHGDVFDHGLGDARLQHANERNVRWKFFRVELIDTRTDREDQLEIWESRRDVVGRHPRHEIADVGGIADVGARAGMAHRARARRRSPPIQRPEPCWPCREPSCRQNSQNGLTGASRRPSIRRLWL
ncbi:hypothetical protein ACVWZ6_007852 [Bradyrhizobium sp. GM6.1]